MHKGRHDRNIRVAEIGEKGQAVLASSSVLVVGVGGLGSPAALYLAAAGVGTIGVADGDVVEASNLNRQIAHSTSDIGRLKTDSVIDSIAAIDPAIATRRHPRIEASEARPVVSRYDFVIDAVDGFGSKFAINDACVAERVPFCHGGATAWNGQIMTWVPGTSCLRCLLPEEPSPTETDPPDAHGIVGAVAGHVGTLQALEAIKHLVGAGSGLVDRMLFFDGLAATHRIIAVPRRPDCPACGHPTRRHAWKTR